MRVLFTANPDSYSGASQQTLRDIESISKRFDFEAVHLGRYKNAFTYLRLLLSRKKYECILIAYPYYCRPVHNRLIRIELRLLKMAARSGRTIAYVVDLPIEQYEAAGKKHLIGPKGREMEDRFFKIIDKVLVFNDAMANSLISNYGIPKERFVQFDMLDYTVEQPSFEEKSCVGHCRIGYAGSLEKKYVEELVNKLSKVEGIELDLYGRASDWIKGITGPTVQYRGEYDPTDIVKELANRCHFGMIIRGEGDHSWDVYHEYTSTSKFSSYLVSGVPILVPSKYGYISNLVRKYDVGLVFDSLENLPEMIGSLDAGRYEAMRRNAYEIGKKIAAGHFLTKALRCALDEESSPSSDAW